MRSLIISLPTTSPLLFPIHSHPVIHKNQPILHVFSYIRSLFIGIDVPLPPIKQAVITTHKHQHKLHLSYAHSDRYFLQRTQQLCTKVGLLCNILGFNTPVTSTSTSTSTSTPQKHVIDLELLPDEWEDEFLQPQPLGSQPSPLSTSPSSLLYKQQHNNKHKKHVKIKTSRNITYHVPATTTHERKHNHKHKHIQTKAPTPPSSHYYTATPTITFAEWEKIPIHLHNLPYTFCIQCEKPVKHQYWYDHHMQAHAQKQSTTSTTTTSPPTLTITTTKSSPPTSTTTTTTTSPPTSTITTTTTIPTPTSSSSTTTPTATKPTKPSKLTYTCPYSGCQHKFNPNTSHFVRDLNAHIDSYHDDTFLYDY